MEFGFLELMVKNKSALEKKNIIKKWLNFYIFKDIEIEMVGMG